MLIPSPHIIGIILISVSVGIGLWTWNSGRKKRGQKVSRLQYVNLNVYGLSCIQGSRYWLLM